MLVLQVPDKIVHVSGALQDVRQCKARGPDAPDDSSPHDVVGIVGEVEQIGLHRGPG
jgi:hypothetical protein